MPATQAQLEQVLSAAATLLGARLHQMVTVEEWVGLARAVAACSGGTTAELLTERDLEEVADDPPLPWDEAVDGPLRAGDED